MKANEAPEKIYIFENPILDFTKLSVKQSDTDIEYIRADAFIEKACDAYCRLCDTKECCGTGECEWVEKFRKRLMK